MVPYDAVAGGEIRRQPLTRSGAHRCYDHVCTSSVRQIRTLGDGYSADCNRQERLRWLVHSTQRSGSPSAAAAAATWVATSSNEDSAVSRPEREASNGLTSRRASKVVP